MTKSTMRNEANRARQVFKERLTLAAVDLFPIRSMGGQSPKMVLGSMPSRPGLLVRLADNHGAFGWGEIWVNFPPRANVHKAQLIEDVVAPLLRGMSFTEPSEIDCKLRTELSTYFLHIGQRKIFEHVLAGLDIALWDLALRSAGRSFASHMGIKAPAATCYASSINAPHLERVLPFHAGLGQTSFKLKVGFGAKADLDFAAKAARICPGGSRLMFDSNQSWKSLDAAAMLSALEDFDPLFVEEPIRADAPPLEWESLATSTKIPLAGGENIYGVDDFLTMANAGIRFLQPDVSKWGGVSGALLLTDTLPDGTNIWPHFMGTAVGQVAALSIAAVAGCNAACEMDVNENRLRTELCGNALEIEDGKVKLPTEPGLVLPPQVRRINEFSQIGF